MGELDVWGQGVAGAMLSWPAAWALHLHLQLRLLCGGCVECSSCCRMSRTLGSMGRWVLRSWDANSASRLTRAAGVVRRTPCASRRRGVCLQLGCTSSLSSLYAWWLLPRRSASLSSSDQLSKKRALSAAMAA